MDVLNGTLATAIVGGLIVTAFLLGPRVMAGSLEEENCSAQRSDSIKAAQAILESMHVRGQLYAELQAFASGAGLVTAGLILAAIYCFAHQITV